MIKEKRTIYKCTFCGREFLDEDICRNHIREETKYRRLTEDWKKGETLGVLNKKYHFTNTLPRSIHSFSSRSGKIITYYDNPVLPACEVQILRWEHKKVYVKVTPLEKTDFYQKPTWRYMETELLLHKIQKLTMDKKTSRM